MCSKDPRDRLEARVDGFGIHHTLVEKFQRAVRGKHAQVTSFESRPKKGMLHEKCSFILLHCLAESFANEHFSFKHKSYKFVQIDFSIYLTSK